MPRSALTIPCFRRFVQFFYGGGKPPSQVSDAYRTKTRVDPAAVWNGSFLPPAAELDVLPRK